MALRTKPRAAYVHARGALAAVGRAVETETTRMRTRGQGSDVAVFHEFVPPPRGGGHQFLAGLVGELRRRQLTVEINRISGGTPACLFNSFNFDAGRLRRFTRGDCRMVHRVDGPIGVYRGFDDGTDREIVALNHALADATVFQSRYSLEMHRKLGFELRDPVVIRNAPDPSLFHEEGRAGLPAAGPVKLITTSWSDNPRKGADVLADLDRQLDPARFTLTFVGRTPVELTHATVLPPTSPAEIARLLREHHVFVFASQNEACSNALLEALACGLPALYVDSGSNAEVVGGGGLAFADAVDAIGKLDEVLARWDELRAAIEVPSLVETADRYLEVLRA